ncbi:MAG: hypothetical protein NC177_17270 [Ruminococcus flavefaciens]|nr:hypothetical protein [Ruminococcus flavefaciens]
MDKQINNCHKNFYKGKNDEEIKESYNKKWIEILQNCSLKKMELSVKKACQSSSCNDIINPTANITCSASKEWNKL